MSEASKPTFVPKYASAVHTCDMMIESIRRQIAQLEDDLRKWEAGRKRALELAEKRSV